MSTETLGMILAILTAATALVIQLQRLLTQAEAYMRELRVQNAAVNTAARALLAAQAPHVTPGP